MLRLFFSVIVAAVATYFLLSFYGYQVNPQNIVYYKPQSNYFETVRKEKQLHPIISRKKGPSGKDAFDKRVSDTVKQATQVDKFETLKKVKSDLQKVNQLQTDQVDAASN